MNELARTASTPGIRPLGQRASDAWHHLHSQVKTEIFFGGSAGPGKTFLGCLWLATACIRYAGIRCAIFRARYDDLLKSSLVTMMEVLQKSGLGEGIHFRYNEGKGQLRFWNGSVIEFDYLAHEPKDPNYTRLGGRAYTYAFIDEADQLEERAAGMLAGRLRYMTTHYCHECAAPYLADRSKPVDCDDEGNPTQWECYACGKWTRGLVPKLLMTGNPGDYWTRTRFIGVEGQPVELKPNQAVVLALLDDNPDKGHVGAYRKKLLEMDDDFDRLRLLNGDWWVVRKTGREFFHAYDGARHRVRLDYQPGIALHFTMDFNSAPYITGLAAQIWYEEQLRRWRCHFLREYCLPHPFSTTEALCQAFARDLTSGAFAGHKAGLFYYGDASGKNRNTQAMGAIRHNYDIVEQELRQHLNNSSDRVLRRNPPHAIVRDFGNAYFSGKLPLWVTFDPSMSHTTTDLSQVKEAADGGILKVHEKDRATGVTYEKYGHCLQAHYYLTVAAFPRLFERFVRKT